MRLRPPRLVVPLMCLVVLAVAPYAAAAGALDDALRARPMCADAQLADVCFVDADHGWAVGDRAAIWHTEDGGHHWALQSSGVDCRLSSVFFLDQNVGWAAGGYLQPYTHTSTGVLLRTRDGGAHWTVERNVILPAVARIGFFDPRHGWAVGQPSALFPAGVVTTTDGGRSWSSLPVAQPGGWLTGQFIDPRTGALAGRSSALATIRRRGVDNRPADFGLRALRDMKLIAPARGWLAGDGGLLLATRDLGNSWQTPEGALPPGVRDHFDFAALAVRGPHLWVAGTPGTRVFHSDDAGRTWTAGDTGQTLPIHALAFVDSQNGYAAGDLGTILATTDGGRTWQRQRGGGARAAYVGFYGRMRDIPLELVARLSADQGYLGAIEVLARDDVEVHASDAADPVLQAHEASVLAGASAASSAWRFPLRQSGLGLSAEQLVDGWNRANDAESLAKLEAHVVARIRMWRPNVVFTTGSAGGGADPLAHIVNQLVLQSVEAAADPTRHSEQVSQAGLQPWSVQKVFAALPAGAAGQVTMDTAKLSARYGRTIGELASAARGVVEPKFVAPQPTLGFRLLVDSIPQEVGRRDFFSGIGLSPGGEARRMFEPVADSDLQTLHREAQRRRNLQAILAAAETDDPSDGRFLADVGEQTRSMRADRAAEVLVQLAQRYAGSGRWEMASECFALVVDRYPKRPLTGVALKWLIQYHASGETHWRNRTSEAVIAQQVIAQPPQRRDRAALKPRGGGVHRAAALGGAGQVVQAGGIVQNLRGQTGERFTKADNYAKQLEQLQPALLAEPTIRFPLAAAHRQLGLPRQAERYYLSLRHTRGNDAWRACAQTEMWLVEPKGDPPKKLWNCPLAKDKPRLDGRLDEPIWDQGNVVQIRSALGEDAAWPAVAMLAYDDEFLYIGVRCTRVAGFAYKESDAPRPRDPDLARQDRVVLLIDIDRDFASYYRLVIDHRGWTGERCWGDKSWDPNWFVASGQTDGAWTAEAAIPLSELTGESPGKGKSWAVGFQRVVPGVGFQSWTTPAAVEVLPEGFGYLLFR